MIIQKGNITFRRITHDDIETLRQWRNSPEVSNYMEYREHITVEMQEKWFKSVDNINNLYFIIEYKGEKIGLINGKDIDWEKRIMETGIFIANQKFINSPVPILAVLTFGELGVITFEAIATAHVLRDNERAKRYNKMIGFRLQEGQEDAENQLYIMTKESYLSKSNLIRKAFTKLMGKHPITITLEKHDIDSGFADSIFNELNNGKIKKVEETTENRILYF